nr:RpiB/LacA/LacB family sugar-phosphate isomerase [Lactobacillus gasseri]
MQASSQKEKNQILEHYLNEAINPNDELINFGIYPDSKIQLSYVQVSIAVALLINSRSLDFIVTGCSSGQGMMLACNTFPNV